MKFELVFIRHGESTGNAIHETHNKDIDFLLELTEKGKQQASITKETLQNETFDSIFCSDMIRTKQTAEIIFGDTYDILYDERLREAFLSTDKDFVINYKEIPKTERVPMRLKGFENGEPFAMQIERMKKFIDMILTGKYGYKIAIITSAGCVRTLDCIFNNMSLEDALYAKKTDNSGVKRFFITKDENGIQSTSV